MQKLKKMLFILLLLISITVFSNTNDQQRQYRIGYTTEYANGQFNSSHFIDNSSSYRSPRRSPERPDPNNPDSIKDDWRMNNDHSTLERIWGWITDPNYTSYDANWPSYINEDYYIEFMSKYGDTPYGSTFDSWWREKHPGQTPPWEAPVGDMPWILGGMFIIAYIIRYKCKE